ncbi:uncharacterized protein LOC121240850 [Juglans microcarpa x Juglans regia]|uniref:uncharacterized protein LOC121240850 n=1 Tax=Juglans microcarpa x Juglans regia TaxID=2249226 RepID=UPI001B7EB2E2|nr:uncharacterized protein LOC121240850 [Juglans microcarpa x Juglans regia]
MKNKASRILKQIIATLSSMAKAKALDLKSKTRVINSRLIIFSLLHKKKFLMVSSLSHSIQQRKSSVSQKLRALLGHHDKHSHVEDDVYVSDQTHAIVPYKDIINPMAIESLPDPTHTELFEEKYYGYLDEADEKDEENFLDFDDQDSVDSMIDLVKNSKEEAGEELSLQLEHDIDHVADIFIKRFHRQLRMQKQLSFSDIPGGIEAAEECGVSCLLV